MATECVSAALSSHHLSRASRASATGISSRFRTAPAGYSLRPAILPLDRARNSRLVEEFIRPSQRKPTMRSLGGFTAGGGPDLACGRRAASPLAGNGGRKTTRIVVSDNWSPNSIAVLSQDSFNGRSGTVTAVALTSQAQRAGFPLTLALTTPSLPKPPWVKISQIRTLSVERIGKRLATVSAEELAVVVEGLSEVIGG